MDHTIGFNSSCSVEAADGSFLIGVGGGIVIREESESSQWVPGEGRYLIGALAYSSVAELLCVTEVKLNVSLHVFRFPERKQVQCLENVATADVQHMMFSGEGELFALLSCIPTTCVTFYAINRHHMLQKCASVSLGDVFCKHLVFPVHRADCVAVLESQGIRIVCNIDSSAFAPSVLTVNSEGFELHSCAWGTEGVYCGTEKGQILLFDELGMKLSTFLDCTTSSTITAISQIEVILLFGTEGGDVFTYDISRKAMKLVVQLGSAVQRLLILENRSNVGVLTNTDIAQLDINVGSFKLIRTRGTGNSIKIFVINEFVVTVCSDGSFVSYDSETNSVVHVAVDFREVALDACALSSTIVVIYASGYVRCFLLDKGVPILSSQIMIPDRALSVCTSDSTSFVAVSDKSIIYFIKANNGFLELLASSDAFCSDVTNMRWTIDEKVAVLATTSNGEVHLIQFAEECESTHASVFLDMSWRLDFPVIDFLPLYVDDAVINIFVHSIDKDSKMYVLDRTREREIKPLRPFFLMHDHECGGTALQRSGNDVVSAGGDGRVIVRDVSHYLAKLPYVPPTKEKKQPRSDTLLRPFGNGGIRCLSVWNSVGGFVCGGNDSIIHFVSSRKLSPNSPWIEPSWQKQMLSSTQIGYVAPKKTDSLSVKQSRERIVASLEDLRIEVDRLLLDRTASVRAEDFLLPSQRKAFDESCEKEICKAKEDDYYSLLKNKYVQDRIRKECWDTMKVQRSKIVSMSDSAVEVHNFHLRKTCPEQATILRKIKFMRMLQLKVEGSFNLSALVKKCSHGDSSVENRTCESLDDVEGLLYDPLDVYTATRAVIQLVLLGGKIAHVKESFNARFDSLKERKSRELNLIEERNDHCMRIMRQLGETTCPPNVLFTPVLDIEEDPRTVFEVFDSEIDPELLKLAAKDDSGAFSISPSAEVALKTWMDGLDKVTEVIRVNVPLPPFADEAHEHYVPPEERSDEQQKMYEEYEKQVVEQTATVNQMRDTLHAEVETLMKANVASAKVVDEEIGVLRIERVKVAQLVDELELHQVNALRLLLLNKTLCNDFLEVKREEADLMNKLNQLHSLHEYRQKKYLAAEMKVQEHVEEKKGAVVEMRSSLPFTNPEWGDRLYRRFTTWYSKYEDGLVKVPQPSRHGVVPVPLFEKYCQCCEYVAAMNAEIDSFREEADLLNDRMVEVETEMKKIKFELVERERIEHTCRREVVERILNVQNLYTLQQGQVQDEGAMVSENGSRFSIRWAKNITDYNDLIFASFEEVRQLMLRTSQLRQSMKTCSWETEHLMYCVGTLEMELRQLHTLRVTRQMQECLHSGKVTSLEEEISKVNARIEATRSVMRKKMEERDRTIAKLKMQISDRRVENKYLRDQVSALKNNVEDKKTVWSMLGEHNNDTDRLRGRMNELYENSELEELARCQQEELVRLKNEIDRLREATFPSFAVVTRRTVR
uniref:Cilia- and flagella-associated protein 43 n=2 Tax=Trypanosoma congolense (strain IL3000) TaxID=1068625 RepID=G0USV1_TRYCI|nr:unnamed protein product [Trypanosoma congolense IL3000]